MSRADAGRIFRRLLGAELLKARSGAVLATMFSFVLTVPLLVVFITGATDDVDFGDGLAATRTFLSIGVSGALGCVFFGSYIVTREDYYRSMDRVFVLGPARLVFGAKVAAAAIFGGLFAILGAAVWTAISAILVQSRGGEFLVGADALAMAAGYLVAGVLGAVMGCGVGWVVRNYYLAVLVLLVLPPIIGVPLLSRARDVERFLPIGASAGLGGVGIDGLLSPPIAGTVLAGWALLAVLVGWMDLRRRAAA
ncbi:hypothetical protein J2Y69_001557 [Microbacterium resistens]|uniref:ABC transporter permease n=1 Tax=Microbacterium resistens TaxID=156977 RepID=A0ABU1SCJ7_9MICO|nr:hypothetical protein [Microbacterium resistens]MDR6866958.1 hypothetical protein [Microbacterium resistens]